MEVGDDFEDPKWNYIANLPKSSENIDRQARLPGGVSANGRWFEPQMRGAPTSSASCKRRRRHSRQQRLDDDADAVVGRSRPGQFQAAAGRFRRRCRLENRLDSHLPSAERGRASLFAAVRQMGKADRQFVRLSRLRPYHEVDSCSCWGRHETKGDIFLARHVHLLLQPGRFRRKEDSAQFIIRADQMGQDVAGPRITKGDCWYTLGMSFGANGQVNYYVRQGVENLTAKDHVASYFAYGDECRAIRIVLLRPGEHGRRQKLVDAVDRRRRVHVHQRRRRRGGKQWRPPAIAGLVSVGRISGV